MIEAINVAATIISANKTTAALEEATMTTEAEVATKASRPAAHIINNSVAEVTLEVAAGVADRVDSQQNRPLLLQQLDQDKLANLFQTTSSSPSKTKV